MWRIHCSSFDLGFWNEEVEGEARPSDIVQTNSPLMTIDLGRMRDLGAPVCMCIQCFASHSVVRLCNRLSTLSRHIIEAIIKIHIYIYTKYCKINLYRCRYMNEIVFFYFNQFFEKISL